jgi:hypothetical protein
VVSERWTSDVAFQREQGIGARGRDCLRVLGGEDLAHDHASGATFSARVPIWSDQMPREPLNEIRIIDLHRPSDDSRLAQIIIALGTVLTIAWIVFVAWVTVKTFGSWR